MSRILLFLIGVAMFSCSSREFVPLSYSPEKRDLDEIQINDNAQYRLEYIDEDKSFFIFSLEVTNSSFDTLWINKKKIKCVASYYPIFDGASVYDQYALYALNDYEIYNIYNERVRKANGALAVIGVLAAGLIVYDAVNDVKDAEDEEWTERDVYKAERRDDFVNIGLSALWISADNVIRSGERAAVELDFLPYELFNKEYILPNERYYGKVLFEKKNFINYFQVTLPDNECQLEFNFRKAEPKEKRFVKKHQR